MHRMVFDRNGQHIFFLDKANHFIWKIGTRGSCDQGVLDGIARSFRILSREYFEQISSLLDRGGSPGGRSPDEYLIPPVGTPGMPGTPNGTKAFGAVAIAVVLAVVLAVIVAVGLHAGSKNSVVSAQDSINPTGEEGASPQQAAARHLSSLLMQSVADRSSVVNAVNDVSQCEPNLTQAAQIFQEAAISRRRLISELASIPGHSVLPSQMTQSLAEAWRASEQADEDFKAWAQDENSRGCKVDDSSDSNFRAAASPDAQATSYKKTFADLWNPVAAKYRLTAYKWSQL
jgi:hypothetical protein